MSQILKVKNPAQPDSIFENKCSDENLQQRTVTYWFFSFLRNEKAIYELKLKVLLNISICCSVFVNLLLVLFRKVLSL